MEETKLDTVVVLEQLKRVDFVDFVSLLSAIPNFEPTLLSKQLWKAILSDLNLKRKIVESSEDFSLRFPSSEYMEWVRDQLEQIFDFDYDDYRHDVKITENYLAALLFIWLSAPHIYNKNGTTRVEPFSLITSKFFKERWDIEKIGVMDIMTEYSRNNALKIPMVHIERNVVTEKLTIKVRGDISPIAVKYRNDGFKITQTGIQEDTWFFGLLENRYVIGIEVFPRGDYDTYLEHMKNTMHSTAWRAENKDADVIMVVITTKRDDNSVPMASVSYFEKRNGSYDMSNGWVIRDDKNLPIHSCIECEAPTAFKCKDCDEHVCLECHE